MSIAEHEVTVTYLTLDRPPVDPPPSALDLQLAPFPDAAGRAEWFYRRVGAAWHWTDRLSWSAVAWDVAIHRPGVELWVASRAGAIVGYFELHADNTDQVELKYFGLLPEAIGRGLGRPLLEAALARAWSLGAHRVTVNTSTLDHPSALGNYIARGFRVERTVTERRVLSP